jgi:hypothetical protein
MTDEFDFVDSTPAAVPLGEHQFHTEDEHVEETVEEVVTVEGDDVDVGVDGEHVTVHEEFIDTPQGGFDTESKSSLGTGYNSFLSSPLRFVFHHDRQIDARIFHKPSLRLSYNYTHLLSRAENIKPNTKNI